MDTFSLKKKIKTLIKTTLNILGSYHGETTSPCTDACETGKCLFIYHLVVWVIFLVHVVMVIVVHDPVLYK